MAFSSLAALLVLTIALGSYPYPYSTSVQAFVTLTVLLPALGYIGFMAFDKVRQTFYPTKEEKKRLKAWERNVKRGRRAVLLARGEVVAAANKKKKKKIRKKSSTESGPPSGLHRSDSNVSRSNLSRQSSISNGTFHVLDVRLTLTSLSSSASPFCLTFCFSFVPRRKVVEWP